MTKKRGLGGNRGLDALLANIKVGRQVEQTVSRALPDVGEQLSATENDQPSQNTVDDNVPSATSEQSLQNTQNLSNQADNPLGNPSSDGVQNLPNDTKSFDENHEPRQADLAVQAVQNDGVQNHAVVTDDTSEHLPNPPDDLPDDTKQVSQADDEQKPATKLVLTVREIQEIKLFWQQGLRIENDD